MSQLVYTKNMFNSQKVSESEHTRRKNCCYYMLCLKLSIIRNLNTFLGTYISLAEQGRFDMPFACAKKTHVHDFWHSTSPFLHFRRPSVGFLIQTTVSASSLGQKLLSCTLNKIIKTLSSLTKLTHHIILGLPRICGTKIHNLSDSEAK